jgi:hypothetical protein
VSPANKVPADRWWQAQPPRGKGKSGCDKSKLFESLAGSASCRTVSKRSAIHLYDKEAALRCNGRKIGCSALTIWFNLVSAERLALE